MKSKGFSLNEIKSLTPSIYDELIEPLYETEQDENAKIIEAAVARLKIKNPGKNNFTPQEVFMELRNG